MLEDSLWYPNDRYSVAFVLVVVLTIVGHMTELIGLTESTAIVLGWIPLPFAYHIGYTLAGGLVLYGFYRVAPDPPERLRDGSRSGHRGGAEPPADDGGEA